MRTTFGAVVRGGTSLAYRTGAWRDSLPVINREKCTSCGICWDVCPDAAVHLRDERYTIDLDYCKGCGLCAHECPVHAIEMQIEER